MQLRELDIAETFNHMHPIQTMTNKNRNPHRPLLPLCFPRRSFRVARFPLGALTLTLIVSLPCKIALTQEGIANQKVVANQIHDLRNSLGTPSLTHEGVGPKILPVWIEQFSADVRTLENRFRVQGDESRKTLHDRLMQDWLKRLASLSFDRLDRDDQVDYLLLKNELQQRLATRERNERRDELAAETIPYWRACQQILLARENVTPIDGERQAELYDELHQQIQTLLRALTQDKGANSKGKIEPVTAIRAAQMVRQLKQSLEETHRFYLGYDPLYSWWCEKPFAQLTESLGKHAAAISKHLAGLDEEDKDKIVGQPIGDQALRDELRFAMIPYSPEELVKIAEREFAWCEAESTKASLALGMGGDYKKALEHVKSLHVEPGEQPGLIRELAWEAIHFLESHDLVTVPPLAANGWRMDMMSPEAQRVNPYFLGGEKIIVSFPTEGMTHREKLMSLRSNNIHFSRATVHHELIPGHHLQHYMTARYRPYRQLFDTPFWVEGWALYWEMLLWDLDFPKSPEDRIGMLFWRRHRCARIVFSLNYHLGRWSAEECVQYLIDNVGHEPSAAAAEVRRSVMGNYGPLYQAAYMLGGLQIRALRKELVDSGTMSNRQFHDAVIQQNSIPIEMVRAALTQHPLDANYTPRWRFGEE